VGYQIARGYISLHAIGNAFFKKGVVLCFVAPLLIIYPGFEIHGEFVDNA